MANIDVLDSRRTTGPTQLDAFFERSSNRADLTIIVDQEWSIHRICTRVRQHRFVGVLRLLCHGDAGFIELGTGMTVPEDTTAFRVLRNCWAGAYPRIEIHGCGVASATPVGCRPNLTRLQLECTPGTYDPAGPGQRLVQAIADNAGVLVIAALNTQRGAPGFEGPVVQCRPAVGYTVRDLIAR